MPPMFLPVLAIDRETIGLIAFVLWILGMVVRAIKSNMDQAPAPPRRGADADRSRMEIETFLHEISGGSAKRPPARPNPPNRPPSVKGAKKPNKSTSASRPATPPKPRSTLSEQHLATSNLGAGLRSHLAEYMQPDRVANEVQQDLKSRIGAPIQPAAAPRARTAAESPSIAAAAVHPLVQVLRDPAGVRQAIALQEVLQRPKSLRRKQ